MKTRVSTRNTAFIMTVQARKNSNERAENFYVLHNELSGLHWMNKVYSRVDAESIDQKFELISR